MKSAAKLKDPLQLLPGDLVRLRAEALGSVANPNTPLLTRQAGPYQSRFRGRGIDFDEVRPYQPGDDLRTMDWRVTARTGRPHTRLYHEERERPVFFIADLGHSMRFASRVTFKSIQAARAASLLAWAAARHGDRVGGLVFAGSRHRELRPASRERGVLNLIHRLCELHRLDPEPNPQALADAALRMQRLAHPGSLIVVLSDFLQLDERARQGLQRLAQHNEVLLIQVHDPIEQEPPPPGYYPLWTPEGLTSLDTSDPHITQTWRQRFQRRRQALQELCTGPGLHLATLSTVQPVADLLPHLHSPQAKVAS